MLGELHCEHRMARRSRIDWGDAHTRRLPAAAVGQNEKHYGVLLSAKRDWIRINSCFTRAGIQFLGIRN